VTLFIDPSRTVPFELDGTVFQIRVLPGRALMRLFGLLAEVREIIGDREDEEIGNDSFTPTEFDAIQQANFSVMVAGIAGWPGVDNPTEDDLDTITPARWGEIVGAIVAANQVSEDDRKNSPSA